MFEVFAETYFSAAHRLCEYPGNCSRWHGHNWTVKATLTVRELDGLGIGLDLRELKIALNEITAGLDHSNLNEFTPFQGKNPTCEIIAEYVYEALADRFRGPNVSVKKVDVYETPKSGASYYRE